MMDLLLISVGMIILTVGIHTAGAAWWLIGLGKRIANRQRLDLPARLFRSVLSTACVLILLHILEAFLWALLFMVLPAQGGLDSLREALYFSMVTFTTLGYGDITLNTDWQLLAGVEGMVGIVVFGLTTALLFAVIQKTWRASHQKPEKGL
jgi:voltage-gated potassium channel